MSAPTKEEALKRYKRFMADADLEHRRVLKEMSEYSQGYGGNSIQGEDLVGLGKVWGDHPPEVSIILANVDAFWGALYSSRREPTFPGFDQGTKDDVLGEYLTMLVKRGRRWAGSDGVEGACLMDLILSGYAFATSTLDTERRPPFRPDEEHIGVDRVWWDAGAREENIEDGQEWVVRNFFGVREAAARYPDEADSIRALDPEAGKGGAASGKGGAPAAGAKSLGGPGVSVSLSQADGGSVAEGDSAKKRLREAPIDDYQFLHFEELVSWEVADPETGQMVRQEASAEEFQAAMERLGTIAQKAGMPFKPPATLAYPSSTWYRCKVLARTTAGEPKILTEPEPIPGGKPLIRAMTGKPEWIMEGEALKRRWFGWGRVLLGLQRLVSVAIRIELEQEARRNRASGAIEEDAFPTHAERQRFVDARAVPGSWPVVPPGAMAKIHEFENSVGSRVSSMRELFGFLAIELPKYILGMSEMNKGTFDGDRSGKFLDTMLQQSFQMQTQFASTFTRFLDQGAITMARLMLELLDPEDLDKILGFTGEKLREGITGQPNPETGELEPIMLPDPAAPPQPNPETGEMEPAMLPMTAGRYLKANAGEIFDHDVAFALRPTAASERAANAQLMLQHGVLKEMLAAGAPPEILLPKMLQASFAQGTIFADMADELESFYENQKAQQEEEAKIATEEGWVAFIQQTAATDFEKASALMTQASEAVLGSQSGAQPPQEVPPS